VHGSRRSFPGGFTEAAMLKGKRVAVTAPASLTAFLLDTLLESARLNRSDVQILTMRLSESAPALMAGELDAVVDLDMGFASPDVIAGPSVARLMPGFVYSFMQFGRALLEADVRLGASFVAAYLRGVRAFRQGHVPEAMDRLARASGMDPVAVRAACRDRLPGDGAIDATSVTRLIDWSVRRQFVRAPIDPDRVIDRRFLEAARS
jgi:NitT/TauT family transport system substrate-binding protein